jgi:hypothetical protein
MSTSRAALVGLGAALLVVLGLSWTRSYSTRLQVGGTRTALVSLPGLDRDRDRTAMLLTDPGVEVGVAVDQGPVAWLVSPGAAPVVVPAAPQPGARLRLERRAGAAGRVLALEVAPAPPRPEPDAAFWAVLVGLAVAGLVRHGLYAAALVTVGAVLLANVPHLLWSAPLATLLVHAGPGLLVLAGGLLWSRRVPGPSALALAFVLGTLVRVYFAFSTGSWDTDYWKAWTAHVGEVGLPRVYGPPDAVPPGHALAQATGREPAYTFVWRGRTFGIDYAPLCLAAWRGALALVSATTRLDPLETENVAMKLPPLLGDVASVVLLLAALRGTRRAWTIAALYWALPVSWLSSAVLGFVDALPAALLLGVLLLAARGYASGSGLGFAVAGFTKATAGLAAPALLVELGARARRFLLATAAGSALVLLPFLTAGTLTSAAVSLARIVHQERIASGFPSPWWLGAHLVSVSRGAALTDKVAYVRTDSVSLPLPILGVLLVFSALAVLAWRQRPHRGLGPLALGAAGAFFAYASLALGVHENHPHAMLLLLAATGLRGRLLPVFGAGVAVLYTANMAFMSGLGRFHGTRYMAIEGLAETVAGWRMAAGFDLTLALVVLDVALLGVLLGALPRLMREAGDGGPGAEPPRTAAGAAP